MPSYSYGWIDLPKSRTRCWLAVVPDDPKELRNYVDIMDDFGVALRATGRDVPHLMMWEPGHYTTQDSNSTMPLDRTYHITALASYNIHAGRFNAFAVHVYMTGDIPNATYADFSSTYTMIRRGNREKKVVMQSQPIKLLRIDAATPHLRHDRILSAC